MARRKTATDHGLRWLDPGAVAIADGMQGCSA